MNTSALVFMIAAWAVIIAAAWVGLRALLKRSK